MTTLSRLAVSPPELLPDELDEEEEALLGVPPDELEEELELLELDDELELDELDELDDELLDELEEELELDELDDELELLLELEEELDEELELEELELLVGAACVVAVRLTAGEALPLASMARRV